MNVGLPTLLALGLLAAGAGAQEAKPLYEAPAGGRLDAVRVTPGLEHWAAVVSEGVPPGLRSRVILDGTAVAESGQTSLPVFSADGAHWAWTMNVDGGCLLVVDGQPVGEKLPRTPGGRYLPKDAPLAPATLDLRSTTLLENVALSRDGKETMISIDEVFAPAVKDQRTAVYVSGKKVHEDALINWFGFTRDGWMVVSGQPTREPYHQLARKGAALAGFRGVYEGCLARISADPPVLAHADGIWINGVETKYEIVRGPGKNEVAPWWASVAWSGDGTAVARVLSETSGSGATAIRRYRVAVDTSGRRTFLGAPYEWCAHPVLSRDGRHVAFRARARGREFAVVDGKEGAPFDQIVGCWFDPAGKSPVVVATAKAGAETRTFALHDGKRHPVSGDVAEVFHPAAAGIPVSLLVRAGRRGVLPLAELDRKGDLEWDWASRPAFGADGSTYSFIARLGEKLVRVERPVKAGK